MIPSFLSHPCLALVLAMVATPAVGPPQLPEPEVEVESIDGDLWCTVVCTDVGARALLSELAAQAEMPLRGQDSIPVDLTLTAELHHRRLAQTLAYLLLGHGLKAEVREGQLWIDPSRSATGAVEDLRAEAELTYLRIARNFPENNAMPRVLLAQARLAHERKDAAASRAHYQSLIEKHPNTEHHVSALIELGDLLVEEREFGNAAIQYSELLSIDRDDASTRTTLLKLVHCNLERGLVAEGRRLLTSLERNHPPLNVSERQERAYANAWIHIASGDGRRALQDLDRADNYGITEETRPVALRHRAHALELLGDLEQASRAWLMIAQESEGEVQREAYGTSARLAMANGDYLGVLFIEKDAALRDAKDAVAPLGQEARVQLHIDKPTRNRVSVQERIDRAARLVNSGLLSEALSLLDSIHLERTGLDTAETQRLVTLRVRALDSLEGIDAAVDALRAELLRSEDPELRRQLWILASDLYEARGMHERAASALVGRLQ